MSNGLLRCGVLWGFVMLVLAPGARAEDWPAYKRDALRSGVSSQQLDLPLEVQWKYRPKQPPRPAWPEPGKELNRLDFDYAFQPVAAGGLVYFGSSADDTVRALDVNTGELTWQFTTDGPVRFAPAIGRGKVFVASDDGVLYALDAQTGKLRWKFRAGPAGDRLLGNGRLIARYPCRTGALLVDDVVYVTAGMWPTEGVFVYALDADTGRQLWCNDSSGSIYTDLPHALASGFSGVAPQGYLVATERLLLVPTGRSVPAAFDRRTGRLLYYKPEKTHYHGATNGGGAWCLAVEIAPDRGVYFNPRNRFRNPSEAYEGEADPCPEDGMIVYSLLSGDQIRHIPGKYRVLVSDGVVYAAGNGTVDAIDLNVLLQKRRLRSKDARWSTAHPARVYCLALAGGLLLTGNRDSIVALDTADGKSVWRVDLGGQQVRGLAVADGRLIAATQTGLILCFAPARSKQKAGARKKGAANRKRSDTSENQVDGPAHRIAKSIIARSGKSEGYALVVGEPDARLAEALARQTQFHVVCLLTDAARIDAERDRLIDAGLYGSRVAIHKLENRAHVPLPPYFADLVVVSASAASPLPQECYRAVRPCGGVACLVGFDAKGQKQFWQAANAWQPPQHGAAGAEGTPPEMIVRGRLPGAGDWRYPWADSGRRGIGDESRVRFPLQLLWFGGPGPGRLLDRHLMPSPPVSTNGRVFLQGQNHVLAFDAYTGRELWCRNIPQVGRKYSQYYSSSLVTDEESVYVTRGAKCLRLDQATGRTLAVYSIPEAVIRQVPRPKLPEYLDVAWPETWHVVGPLPKGSRPLPPERLKTVPDRVTVGGKQYVARELRASRGILDFTRLYGGYGFQPLAPDEKPASIPRRGKQYSFHDVGRVCYSFAKIQCPRAGKLLVGAGADWGMRWYLDGRLVFDALRNDSSSRRRGFFSRKPCSPSDEVFDVDVTAGEHVLAVMVTAGSRGWALASASMATRAKELMPVSAGENPNVPNLRDLIWGYLSVTDELVLGSYNVPVAEGQPAESHLLSRSESKALFALDKKDGSLRWVYRAKPNRVVANIEIAFGDGRLFLIDGTSKADLVRARRRHQRIQAELSLVALDLTDGYALWQQEDVPVLGDRAQLSRLKTNPTHLFMGLPSWGHLVYADGVVLYGANAAYDARTGKKLWQKDVNPGKLPVVYGDRIITSASAYDLRTGQPWMVEDFLTGERVPWRYVRAYGCGPVAGCRNVLFFRSGADGFLDMETEGTTNFGGVRSGCARTLLAANGLLIHTQGYSGCACSYNYKANLALIAAQDWRHADEKKGKTARSGAAPIDTWYVLPQRSHRGAIKRIAINFGAPGDRRDRHGRAWLGFPRPLLDTACPAPVTLAMSGAECTYRRRTTSEITESDVPWVYSSALHGQGRIAIDLTLEPGIAFDQRRFTPIPTIDGMLEEACWKDAVPVPFENTPFSMLGARIDFRLFRDAENIYFGYRCRSAPQQ
ncbi:MAG: PQQ-binding-like beta-propeller repeat protein, partial [Planctomycetes bacterium]|nr:PQQ-binding-like beta-propeller repeat protein [Planctomycetota bacterium]